jgi:hypothetical protein
MLCTSIYWWCHMDDLLKKDRSYWRLGMGHGWGSCKKNNFVTTNPIGNPLLSALQPQEGLSQSKVIPLKDQEFDTSAPPPHPNPLPPPRSSNGPHYIQGRNDSPMGDEIGSWHKTIQSDVHQLKEFLLHFLKCEIFSLCKELTYFENAKALCSLVASTLSHSIYDLIKGSQCVGLKVNVDRRVWLCYAQAKKSSTLKTRWCMAIQA